MYAYVYPGETKKRTLEDSDVTAVQLAYWQADNPSENTGGCTILRRPSRGSKPWVLCLVGWLLLRRRPNRPAKAHLLSSSGRLHA